MVEGGHDEKKMAFMMLRRGPEERIQRWTKERRGYVCLCAIETEKETDTPEREIKSERQIEKEAK